MITIKHKKYGDITFDDGTSRQEIANYLVEVDSIGGEQFGTLETLGTQAGRSMGSSIRQIKEWAGVTSDLEKYEDQLAEYESRIMMEQSPATSIGGMLAGGFLDPVTIPAIALKPLTFASKVATFGARGAAQGAAGGALEPVYEQYGDSTVLNIMAGTALGGGLGAGIGKLLTKSTPKSEVATEETSEALQDTSERTLTNLASTVDETPVRNSQQALDKVIAEMELEAAGAPTSADLGGMRRAVESTKARINALDSVIFRMKGTGKAPLGSRNASRKVEAQKIEANKELQGLESKYLEAKTLRKAAENLKKVKDGKVIGVEGFADRLKSAVPIKRSPISQAVNESARPPSINPLNSKTSRILGTVDRADAQYNPRTGRFEADAPVNVKRGQVKPLVSKWIDDQGRPIDEDGNVLGPNPNAGSTDTPVAGTSAPLRTPDTTGSQRVAGELNQEAGKKLLPRTAGKPEVTKRLVDGKFKGDNPETTMPMKESGDNAEIRERLNRKEARGEELTQDELRLRLKIDEEWKIVQEFKKFVQQIAGSRSLDTAALRGMSRGRYSFDNIKERAQTLLKRNGIEDMEDMANYILSDKDRIFSSEEMDMLVPLFIEAEKRLLEVQRMTRFSDVFSDTEIAALHSEINLYYGISAWNKGQGSKVAATLNHRKKMRQDIADGREIDSLWAGRKCQ